MNNNQRGNNNGRRANRFGGNNNGSFRGGRNGPRQFSNKNGQGFNANGGNRRQEGNSFQQNSFNNTRVVRSNRPNSVVFPGQQSRQQQAPLRRTVVNRKETFSNGPIRRVNNRNGSRMNNNNNMNRNHNNNGRNNMNRNTRNNNNNNNALNNINRNNRNMRKNENQSEVTVNDLNDQLDTYFGRAPEAKKQQLDAELEAYMNQQQ
ncbi:hypothetical protein WA158_006615 [Blastocystis sp. Blastoise]